MLKFKEDKTGISYQIREMIYRALLSLYNESDIKITLDEVEIEHPEEESHGDYSSNVAMKIAQQVGVSRHSESAGRRDEESRGNQGSLSSDGILRSAQDDGVSKQDDGVSKQDDGVSKQDDGVSKVVKIKNPRELAELVVKNLPKADFIEKVEVAGVGFINFWLTEKYLLQSLENSIQSREKYGRSELGHGQKIMVEFAHPNTHKLFHIGHLRNITIGEAICRLLTANGVEVIRANYQGDVGLHIAKCLWAIRNRHSEPPLGGEESQSDQSKQAFPFSVRDPSSGFTGLRMTMASLKTLDEKIAFLGEAYREGNKAYEENEQAKKEIEEINHQIYQKDPAIVDLWQETRKWSLEYFDLIYQRLGTKFDRLYFESEVADLGKKLVMKSPKVFEKSEGAIIFDGEKYGLHKRVFINSQGLPTYEAKDIGLAQLQFKEHHPDLIIHSVGPEQSGYFQVLFKALEGVLPEVKGREYHRIYGWVRLKEGKMSSRAGKVVLGEWLLREVEKRISELMKGVQKSKADKEDRETLASLAVAAVKYAMLKLSAERELVFDVEESVSLEGDSGVYLEYVFARTRSVLNKAKSPGRWRAGQKLKAKSILSVILSPAKPDEESRMKEGSLSSDGIPRLSASWRIARDDSFNPEERAILRTIYRFPEVVREAGEKLSPNVVAGYLYDLAGKFNTFYNKHRIIGSENESFRLALTAGVGQVMEKGLELLGIKAVGEM